MKNHLIPLAVFGALVNLTSAQDHLIPDTGVFVDPNSYQLKIRHVFEEAFDKGVSLRALVLPSFELEYVVGLRKTDQGMEAFVLEPSSRIYDTEVLEMYKNGQITAATSDGNVTREIPLEQNQEYLRLKKRTPEDYRTIKAIRLARQLPGEIADRIGAIWEVMLLDVRHPKRPRLGADGVTYDFSAWVEGRGDISGQAWSPNPESKSGRLVTLAESLAAYSRGKEDLDQLKAKLVDAEKSIKPPARRKEDAQRD